MQECKADICIEIENFLEDNQCTLSESFKQEILKNVPTEMRQDLDIDTINNIFSDENQKLHLKNFLNSILGKHFLKFSVKFKKILINIFLSLTEFDQFHF